MLTPFCKKTLAREFFVTITLNLNLISKKFVLLDEFVSIFLARELLLPGFEHHQKYFCLKKFGTWFFAAKSCLHFGSQSFSLFLTDEQVENVTPKLTTEVLLLNVPRLPIPILKPLPILKPRSTVEGPSNYYLSCFCSGHLVNLLLGCTSGLNLAADLPRTSGQSYKQFTLVNYNSRVLTDLKTPHIMTLGS